MISDYDRRELAEKLREMCDEIENECNGLTVLELADILNIREDGSWLIKSFDLDDVRYLADLIDPTCHLLPSSDRGFGCDRCFTWFPSMKDKPNFCPNCGAEVVRTSD